MHTAIQMPEFCLIGDFPKSLFRLPFVLPQIISETEATCQRSTLRLHCNGNSVYIFLFGELRVLSPNFHIHVSVNDLYSPRIGPHISSSRKGRPRVEIYDSLTDTWMWKLGLRPQYSFTGNICFKFSAFCLCSVVPYSLSAFPGPVRLLLLVPDRGLYHIFFSAFFIWRMFFYSTSQSK
jgi:hypothetical protein